LTRLVRAELLKLRTTQVWFWLLLATVAVAVLFVVAPIASDSVHTPDDVAQLFTLSSTCYVFVFVLGVLGVTSEFRHKTITPTVLQTPSRWALVTAKMITYAVVGVVYAAVALAVQLVVAVPWLGARGVSVPFSDGGVQHALIGVFGVVALFGIVGLGVGALLRNQIVAVVVGIVFLLLLQNIIDAIPKVKDVYPYLPGGATAAILHTSGDDTVNGVHLLPTWGGVLMLVLWALVPAVVGASVSMTRDIP
jgi:ABC-2 type transport system permease protein